MISHLSSRSTEADTGFSRFQRAICQIADLSAHRIGKDAYNAYFRKNRVGFLDCSFVNCDPVVIERNLTNIDRDKGRDYLLALQLSGSGTRRHLGRETKLSAGDFTIADSTLPYSIEFDSTVHSMVVRLPRSEFLRRGLTTDRTCGYVFDGKSGTSGLASRILQTFGVDGLGIDFSAGNSLASAIIDLIADSNFDSQYKAQTQLSQSSDKMVCRIRAIVLSNLADPDLSVSRVAELTGISVRYLHKIFSQTGVTLREWIETERLNRAYQNLKDKNGQHRTIQEIAYSNGFNDAGYFAYRFSKRYGLSPSEVRRKMQV